MWVWSLRVLNVQSSEQVLVVCSFTFIICLFGCNFFGGYTNTNDMCLETFISLPKAIIWDITHTEVVAGVIYCFQNNFIATYQIVVLEIIIQMQSSKAVPITGAY